MPLSDREQQLLEQLEQQLRSEDPRFAQNISRASSASEQRASLSARSIVIGIVILLCGAVVVVASLYFLSDLWTVLGGVVGFAVMTAGGYIAFARSHSKEKAGISAGGAKSTDKRAQSPRAAKQTFMQRLEDRWERRQRGDN